jgi:Ca2+-binding RTX toxin-like protein
MKHTIFRIPYYRFNCKLFPAGGEKSMEETGKRVKKLRKATSSLLSLLLTSVIVVAIAVPSTLITTVWADDFFGTSGADTIDGTDNDDNIFGEQGDDNLSGEGGDDYIDGHAGDDEISDGLGSDIILAGTGRDNIEIEGTGED